MDLHALWTAFSQIILAIPRSGLLIFTLCAIVGSVLGGMLARRGSGIGRLVNTLSSFALAGVLVVVVLQVARFDPRLDIAVPELGLPPQTVAGGETRIPMAPDGHFWVRATVNGVTAPFLVDTGATLTAVSDTVAEKAGISARKGSLPVRIETANGSVTAQLATVDTIGFGNVEASGLDAVIAPNFGETNVIGMNLLSRLASWRVEGNTLIMVPKNPRPMAE